MRARMGWWLGLAALAAAGGARAQNRPPIIQHEPPAVAIRGQPLIVRARVSDDHGAVRSVKLFYAVSRDAAPFEIPMEASGEGVFVAVIAPHLFAGIERFSYYIEAMDDAELASETPWHVVRLQTMDAGAPEAEKTEGGRPRWVLPAVIGGVAAAAVGVAAAASGGGGGGGDEDEKASDPAGNYAGITEVVVRDPGVPAAVSTRDVTIFIAPDGRVVSENLHEGGSVIGQLSGASFSITAPVSEPGVTGRITYSGTVAENRIRGTIEGTRTTAAGEGTYSGYFTLQKQ